MTRTYDPTRRTALGLIAAALALPSPALARGAATFSGTAFGTQWRVSSAQVGGVATLLPQIEALFSEIDRRFSPWRPNSTISRFNADRAGASEADPALIEVTAEALTLARRSEGAFDPTVGPLVAQWGFGPIGRGGAPDWRGLSVGVGGLTKSRDDLTLDLCGIAKGWALDQAVSLVRAEGLGDLIFELGGELVAVGHHPDGRAWRVAVESPTPGQPAPLVLRLPAGLAVATSGTRGQSFVLNGHRYSHIIDPRSRMPATGGLRSVTVVAEDAITADGWATALFAAGDVAGPDLAATEDIAAVFLIEDGGAFRQVPTGPMSELIL